jgi:hypothetical protein
MSDWSTNAARKFSEKKKDDAERIVKQNREHELIAQEWPELWAKLRTKFNEEIIAFNNAPGIESGCLSYNKATDLVVNVSRKNIPEKKTVITFNSEQPSVKVDGPGVLSKNSKLRVRASETGKLYFADSENAAISEASIVEEVLTGLLEI